MRLDFEGLGKVNETMLFVFIPLSALLQEPSAWT